MFRCPSVDCLNEMFFVQYNEYISYTHWVKFSLFIKYDVWGLGNLREGLEKD